jgi:hypothetical protein
MPPLGCVPLIVRLPGLPTTCVVGGMGSWGHRHRGSSLAVWILGPSVEWFAMAVSCDWMAAGAGGEVNEEPVPYRHPRGWWRSAGDGQLGATDPAKVPELVACGAIVVRADHDEGSSTTSSCWIRKATPRTTNSIPKQRVTLTGPYRLSVGDHRPMLEYGGAPAAGRGDRPSADTIAQPRPPETEGRIRETACRI